MSQLTDKLTAWQKIKLGWYQLWRAVLHLWVRAKRLPEPFSDAHISADKPTCYVLDQYALSSLLILDQMCEKTALPRPLLPIREHLNHGRAYATLRRLKGMFIRYPSTRRSSEVLKELIDQAYAEQDFDIQLVPVSVFIGRAPDKETSLAKILFSEGWDVGGRLRRLISTWINGRNVFVQFSKPISLRELANEEIGASRSLRKVSRILRTHFRRVRTAAVGPDLSHRRTVINTVLRSPSVRAAISQKAKQANISEAKAERQAQKYAKEIAAHYSYTFVRIASLFLSWFWNRIYNGVNVNHFQQFQAIAPEHEVIYVPCHRSHIDYLLMSYLLYHRGFVPPHVAAGVNLNLPVVGGIIRKGGAFFLRRSFRAQKLYSAVFNEYFSHILSRGVSIEYFIEGTRSRTGRLLPPRGGMLAMTVRGFLRTPSKPIMFQPVYIGYEKLTEGNAYTYELEGQKKKSESLRGLFSALKILRKNYGKVHVNFSEPVFLNQLLDKHQPAWREQEFNHSHKPVWLNPLIDELGNSIMTQINASADVNPINLLAMTLLASPRHALAEEDAKAQIELYQNLALQLNYAEEVSVSDLPAEEIIDYGIELKAIERKTHGLGDIIALNPEHAVLQTYFRNNVLHIFAIPAYLACCFLNERVLPVSKVRALGMAVYPFLRAELFLPWQEAELDTQLDISIELLIEAGLLSWQGDTHLLRAEGGSDEALQLKLLGRSLLQTLERYYITIAILVKNGSGKLSSARLEKSCIMAAQRISMLTEFDAPEFYDKTLFKQFIKQLRERRVLTRNDEGLLEFDETLARISEDAKIILNKDIRHSIIQVAPRALERPAAQTADTAVTE